MRVFLLSAIATVAFAAAVIVGISSCGDKVQTGLTGIDIQVTFESDLQVRYLRFSGFIGHAPAFPRDDRPHENRELDPTDENLIVLLPDTMGEKSVFVRVDGIDEFGSILASAGELRLVERDKILAVRLHLGEPRVCGDTKIHPSAEQCDDGNQLGDDGCSGECVVETDWECEGEPSVCRTCGDGVCSVGEDYCSCQEDCAGSMCGDGLCCGEMGEDVCSCPDDCQEEGAATCPDGHCCAAEREAETCEPDCGDCGDDVCERDKEEDSCTCPTDCPDAPPICGNQCCGGDETLSSCPVDCCPPVPTVDGVCCPNESAETTPEDCCDSNALCGDSECCPGEDPSCPECCADVCGDDVCCGGENPDNCARDCCPSCTEDVYVCPGCCADECAQSGCTYNCGPECSCEFDCRPGSQCEVFCTASSCHVECGDKPCTVHCEGDNTRDAGVVGEAVPSGECSCTGSNCQLDCGPTGVVVPCGNNTIACSPAACP